MKNDCSDLGGERKQGSVKPLETRFRHNGFDFRQINREGGLAIFEQSKGNVTTYEVVKISRHNGFTVAGKKFPAAETYPPTSEWGSRGWTYVEKKEAMRKMCELAAA